MNEQQTWPSAEHPHQAEQRKPQQPTGAESPHHLLAVHDPSTPQATGGQPTSRRGNGATIEWLRPTELATRVAGKVTARAVAAHVSVHRRARARLRAGLAAAHNRIGAVGRLAPGTAFGRQTATEQPATNPASIDR